MAIVTFVRMLGAADAQTDEVFQKFSLDNIDRVIVTADIFKNNVVNLIVNACGEATLMLTNLSDDSNNNIDCISLCKRLWLNLLEHINKAENMEHVNLIWTNVKQLLGANATVFIKFKLNFKIFILLITLVFV